VFPIHLGISADFKAPSGHETEMVLSSMNIRKPYLLTVGTVEPRKNLEFLVGVFERMKQFDGSLVIAGMRGWKYEPILERIRSSARSRDIRYVEYVEDSQLPALYAGAELFLCASLYEGFGFPPLEAMACGILVISSGGGSLGEVLGDGALILRNCDQDAWKVQAETLLGDSGKRSKLIAEGFKKAASYRWEDTAKKTWKVYMETGQ